MSDDMKKSNNMEKNVILGLPIDNLSMSETVQEIRKKISSGGIHQHLGVNAAKLVEAYEDAECQALFRQASIISADGQSVVWASRLLGRPLPERVTGIDLMENLITLSIEEGFRIYLLGASTDVVQEVARRYAARGANIVGFNDGFWRAHRSDESMAKEIASTDADLLFVGVPSPMKEDFITNQLKTMMVPMSIGVGGSFDVVAGEIKRAPLFYQKLGLEWVYRLVQEPRRLLKRYLVGNSKFIYYIVKARVSNDLN